MSEEHDIRILVVDDERHICELINESLVSEKYKVSTFSNPEEALRFLESNYVDIVLTDLMMGRYSGEQVLKRTLELYPDAVVILMTAHPTVTTAITALKSGAFDFIIKPFKIEFLKAAIERGLTHQSLYRENLRLRGQVEFLSAANALGGASDIDEYLRQVLRSCKMELSALGAALIQIDPESGDVIRSITEVESDDARTKLTNISTVTNHIERQDSSPLIQAERVSVQVKTCFNISISKPICVHGILHGVINLLVQSQSGRVAPGELDVLTILSNSAGAAIANDDLYSELQSSYLTVINALANAIEARDNYTAGHTDRVTTLAYQLALALGWNEDKLRALRIGCTLHDIGKIGVPDAILNKPSQLTEEEVVRMKDHPQVGLRIVSSIRLLEPAIPYIVSHHERFDGSGYPNGLRGEEIPIEGRLLSVVDTFDAIISDRPYRKGAPLEVAVRELAIHRGTQFDPELVDLFLDLIRDGKIDLIALYNKSFDFSCLEPEKLNQTVQA